MPEILPDGGGPTALVFPGQGAHAVEMLLPFADAPRYQTHLRFVCALLGHDPIAEAAHDPAVLNRNADSSLLTVLASVLCLEQLRNAPSPCEPVAYAGYSVGQWTALYAAGALTPDELFTLVHERARIMDDCLASLDPSGMLAVVGIPQAALAQLLADAGGEGLFLELTNDNAPGQCTLGGSESGLRFAEARLALLRPRRLVRLPVAGAWHSRLLAAAVPRLDALLQQVTLRAPSAPVIDNTTGDLLPTDRGNWRHALARQVASPVRWRQGIGTLVRMGVTHFVEVGFGDVLTRFGFFIDRQVTHSAVAPPARQRT